ncbi:transcription factor spTFIIE alpha subunit [Purpureocillium lilacinum]|uniref:Transcription factor spTFIIE alpha subunit n=1 Tax=Purpureocillium lilacinum TaxID=33203 RepID=A0A179F6W4_PURLI|nr:transcription factor spTFIIE alpha subunit [Purpureocillium lilacinum]OAQ60839.1 transcription factor spTFIIE alpha subunit [Purpureocillium lilacinum]
MDLAVTLIKSVMRAFYPTRDILLVDALVLHEALRDDHLAYLMAINTKDLHEICGKLSEDRFLAMHTRQELREGNLRPSNRTWYYINYRHTIDAIKWRVYSIDREVQGSTVAANEKKEYICTFCKAEWTTMEVLDNFSPNGFLCHRCYHTLTSEADRNSGGHEQSSRLHHQFKFISELLPKIDAVYIPECDFDRALSKARPVIRDATHQRAATVPVEGGGNQPTAVKGLANTGPQSITVNILTSDGPSEADKAAEKALKEKIAERNALPAWMSNSTVTGESFSGAAATDEVSTVKSEAIKHVAKGMLQDDNASAQIDGICEKLKAEQTAERAREAGKKDGGDDDDEDDDEFGSDEEDEFEDVPATATSSG